MKRALLAVLPILAIVFCAFSQSPTNYIAKFDSFDDPPNNFPSEKELKEHLLVDESHDYIASKKNFFVCLSRYPTANATCERVSCWYRAPNTDKLIRVWDVRLIDAGPIKFDFDNKTTRLSLIAAANTPFKGQPLASVVLSIL